MDAMVLLKNIQDELQGTADILGIDFPSATTKEKALLLDMTNLPTHHKEWYLAIGPWNGSKPVL